METHDVYMFLTTSSLWIKFSPTNLRNIKSKFGPNANTKILSGKKPTKHYDSFGALIPDDDEHIKQDLAAGHRVIYYHEDKPQEPDKKEVRRKR